MLIHTATSTTPILYKCIFSQSTSIFHSLTLHQTNLFCVYELVETTPESHTFLFRICVYEQETVGFIHSVVINIHKLILCDIGSKILIDLLQLFQISSPINKEMRSIQSYHSG